MMPSLYPILLQGHEAFLSNRLGFVFVEGTVGRGCANSIGKPRNLPTHFQNMIPICAFMLGQGFPFKYGEVVG